MSHSEIAPGITADPDILDGKPVVSGTRLGVELILRELSMGVTHTELLASYPTLTEDGIRAACAYGATLVAEERIFVPAK